MFISCKNANVPQGKLREIKLAGYLAAGL